MTAVDRVCVVDRFQHEAFMYRDDAHFVEFLGSFVRAGLEHDEAVAVAEPAERIDLLRDALGRAADDVQFFDMYEIGVNPSRIIAVWKTFVAQQVAAGRSMRGVGEPAWPGRRRVELDECGLHELLLNRAFDDGPGWRLLCPYDAANLPPDVLERALHTHPIRSDTAGFTPSDAYHDEAILAAFKSPLSPPPPTARGFRFDVRTLTVLRRTVRDVARTYGLAADRVDDLVLASSEIAANSTRYGGGVGDMLVWTDAQALIIQFADAGHIVEPLVGRSAPAVDSINGRGIYLANQVCDLVQLRSSSAGTTVRLVTWL